MTNVFEFSSLRRSGHHAVMSWVVKNLTDITLSWNYRLTHLYQTNSVFYNDATLRLNEIESFLTNEGNNKDIIYLNYEDEYPDYTLFSSDRIFKGPHNLNQSFGIKNLKTERFYIIRDFYSTLCSRIKANNDLVNGERFSNHEDFIEKWKKYAYIYLKNQNSFIRYEDWLTDSNYRNQFLINNFNTYERFDTNFANGWVSSFSENPNNYFDRFDINLIPEETKKLIMNDYELHYLIGTLNYKFRKL